MKNIITILIMVFAFTVSASAQSAKAGSTPEEKAKSDLFELTKAIDNDSDVVLNGVYDLLVRKHQIMADNQISKTEKNDYSNLMDGKLKASFSDIQIEQLKAVPGLYEKLIK